MNDRIRDLLAEAADDDRDRPMSFGPADVVDRGRAARGRRTALVAGAPLLAAAAVAAITLATGLPGDAPRTTRPTDPYVATQTTDPGPTAPPFEPTYVAPVPGLGWTGRNTPMTQQDAEIMSRCVGLAPEMEGWRFDAQVTDAHGTTATFVSDDHTEWRECTLGAPGDSISEVWTLDASPVPEPWETPDSGVSSATLCPKGGPPSCMDALYTAALPLRFGVADVSVRTPAGRQAAVALGVVTYVVRFTEGRSIESTPPVVATLRDRDGATILRYDYNELMR